MCNLEHPLPHATVMSPLEQCSREGHCCHRPKRLALWLLLTVLVATSVAFACKMNTGAVQVLGAPAAGARLAQRLPHLAPHQVLLLQEHRLRLPALLLPGLRALLWDVHRLSLCMHQLHALRTRSLAQTSHACRSHIISTGVIKPPSTQHPEWRLVACDVPLPGCACRGQLFLGRACHQQCGAICSELRPAARKDVVTVSACNPCIFSFYCH